MNLATEELEAPIPNAASGGNSARFRRRRFRFATATIAAIFLSGSLNLGCVMVAHPRSPHVVVKGRPAKKTVVVRGLVRPRVGCWWSRRHWVCPVL